MVATSEELIGMRGGGTSAWSGEGLSAHANGCGRLPATIPFLAAMKGCRAVCMDNCTFVPPPLNATEPPSGAGDTGDGVGEAGGVGGSSNDSDASGGGLGEESGGRAKPPPGSSATTASGTDAASGDGDGALGGGAMAGVVVAGVMVLVLAGVLVVWWKRRQQEPAADPRIAEMHGRSARVCAGTASNVELAASDIDVPTDGAMSPVPPAYCWSPPGSPARPACC